MSTIFYSLFNLLDARSKRQEAYRKMVTSVLPLASDILASISRQ